MIALVPSAGAALLSLILAAVVGYRGGRSPASASFALAMGGLAITQAGYALMLRGSGGAMGAAISTTAELATPARVGRLQYHIWRS